jgi:hypothetical protein
MGASSRTTVTLEGGPQHGRIIDVHRAAGHCPPYLGVDGSTYLIEGRTDSADPVYRWEPVTVEDRAADARRKAAEVEATVDPSGGDTRPVA